MSVTKVSFNAFYNAFKQSHPSCTAPQSTLNKIWNELKHKYKCDQQKYRHHGGAKAFSDEFHTEALEMMNQWKINYKQKNAAQQSRFYGLFSRNKNKHKNKNKNKNKSRKRHAQDSSFNPKKLYKFEAPISKPIQSKHTEFIKLITDYEAYAALKELVSDGVLSDFQKYQQTDRNINKLAVLCVRIHSLKLKPTQSMYHALILESKLFEKQSFQSLLQIQSNSAQYKYAKTLRHKNYGRMSDFMCANAERVSSLRGSIQCCDIVLWADLVLSMTMEPIIKCIDFFRLETNYKTQRLACQNIKG